MPIIAKATYGAAFEPAPEGTWASICVDVIDMGMFEYAGRGQNATIRNVHKVDIVWQIDCEIPGKNLPYIVRKRYTLSLHEKASLRRDLEAWRGKGFSTRELAGFDLENLIGAPCLLLVVQAHRDGTIFSNISAIMRLPKTFQVPEPRGYVRVKDRPDLTGKPIEENANGTAAAQPQPTQTWQPSTQPPPQPRAQPQAQPPQGWQVPPAPQFNQPSAMPIHVQQAPDPAPVWEDPDDEVPF